MDNLLAGLIPHDCHVSDSDADSVPEEEREALLTIAHGAVVTSGGIAGQRLLATGVEIMLARGLGPVTYGVYALAWRIAELLSELVTFGGVPALQRFLPAYDGEPRRQAAVVGLAYVTTAVVGIGIGASIWLTAPQIDQVTLKCDSFRSTIRLFSLLVGLLGVTTIAAAVFRAVGSARGEVVFNKLLKPGVRAVAAGAALVAGCTVVGVAGSIVMGIGVLAISSVVITAHATGVTPSLGKARSELLPFLNHAAPVAMSSLGKVFQSRIDVLLVGALLTAVAAGVYNAVLVLIAIAWIPLQSFNQLLPPVASQLYADDRTETLNTVYTSVTRLIVTTVVPVIAVLGVFGREILAVFGATYTQGYVPLVVYLGGILVGSAVGATGWLLLMTEHQYARMLLDWLLAGLNVTLTYVFITRFGLVGAALGTSLAISVQNGIQVVLLRRFEGLWPFDRTFIRPILAGSIASGLMATVRIPLDGGFAVVSGTLLGVIAYIGILWLIGIDARDQLIVTELYHRYRTHLFS